jgi:hypothetical protein
VKRKIEGKRGDEMVRYRKKGEMKRSRKGKKEEKILKVIPASSECCLRNRQRSFISS